MYDARMISLEDHVAAHDAHLSALFADLASACKRIALSVNRAGLLDILGEAGVVSHQGDTVKKLDLYAHDILVEMLSPGGQLCLIGSEEELGITVALIPTDLPGVSIG